MLPTVIQAALKVLEKKFPFFRDAENLCKRNKALKVFELEVKVLELQYFIIIVTTM